MKKLINNPENVVTEALKGMELAYPDLIKVQYNPNFVMRADAPVKNKVALISGGGAGMNQCTEGSSAKACSTPLALVPSSQARRPIRSTPPRRRSQARRAISICEKYTGDVMNFELAADAASRKHSG